jgi:hypothetical protein
MERMTLPIMLKIKIIIIIINKIKLGNKECPDSEIIISELLYPKNQIFP